MKGRARGVGGVVAAPQIGCEARVELAHVPIVLCAAKANAGEQDLSNPLLGCWSYQAAEAGLNKSTRSVMIPSVPRSMSRWAAQSSLTV